LVWGTMYNGKMLKSKGSRIRAKTAATTGVRLRTNMRIRDEKQQQQ